jgi:hypothetical protein
MFNLFSFLTKGFLYLLVYILWPPLIFLIFEHPFVFKSVVFMETLTFVVHASQLTHDPAGHLSQQCISKSLTAELKSGQQPHSGGV